VEETVIEVRFHGRGGQGAVTASKILASAFVRAGKFAASFPMFGFERRGAPVTAFGRFGDMPIREKTKIYNPDILVVLDPTQKNSENVTDGIVENGLLILNTDKPVQENIHNKLKTIGYVDANKISINEIGRPMPNTCIIGAFAKTTGFIDIEPIIESLEEYFSGSRLEKNIICARRGFEETNIVEF
jgi:2-oxoacid:acceptor oxidoreductase gamma subunit (pyruvate/2-ketoisovalerate family)